MNPSISTLTITALVVVTKAIASLRGLSISSLTTLPVFQLEAFSFLLRKKKDQEQEFLLQVFAI